MKRGEIWTVSGGSDYAGKPRPAVILQDKRFDATALCASGAGHGARGGGTDIGEHRNGYPE